MGEEITAVDTKGGVERVFREMLAQINNPKVLELGTRQWILGRPTHHGSWLSAGSTHVKSDITSGEDVDVVADAHDLSPFGDGEFDAVIAISVWEHLRKPWIAAEAARRVLKNGGLIYVATHHSFPVHGYPSDYCRWTDEGLKALFDEPEWRDAKASFSYPCSIIPPKEVKAWNSAAKAFLNVDVVAIKA